MVYLKCHNYVASESKPEMRSEWIHMQNDQLVITFLRINDDAQSVIHFWVFCFFLSGTQLMAFWEVGNTKVGSRVL